MIYSFSDGEKGDWLHVCVSLQSLTRSLEKLLENLPFGVASTKIDFTGPLYIDGKNHASSKKVRLRFFKNDEKEHAQRLAPHYIKPR